MFAEEIADQLAALPGVVAVSLGGSRALDSHRPDSDWDFGLYYRSSKRSIDPADVGKLGYEGTVVGPGEWGPIVNGGAWLVVDGRKVDLLYRDLDEIEQRINEADDGVFQIVEQMGYVAGAPTYLPVGELASARVLRGSLPRPDFPPALRARAPRRWHERAETWLDFAQSFAVRRDVAPTLGAVARAVVSEAHARLCARSEWVLNEKGLTARASLGALDAITSLRDDSSDELTRMVDAVRGLVAEG